MEQGNPIEPRARLLLDVLLQLIEIANLRDWNDVRHFFSERSAAFSNTIIARELRYFFFFLDRSRTSPFRIAVPIIGIGYSIFLNAFSDEIWRRHLEEAFDAHPIQTTAWISCDIVNAFCILLLGAAVVEFGWQRLIKMLGPRIDLAELFPTNQMLLEKMGVDDEWIPDEFKCPINYAVIDGVPVYTASSHYRYGKEFLLAWVTQNRTDPIGHVTLDPKDILPDFVMEYKINVFITVMEKNINLIKTLPSEEAKSKVKIITDIIDKIFKNIKDITLFALPVVTQLVQDNIQKALNLPQLNDSGKQGFAKNSLFSLSKPSENGIGAILRRRIIYNRKIGAFSD